MEVKNILKKVNFKSEEGFWSAVFILTLTALGVLSLVTYIAVQYESQNTVNQRDVLQADYAVTSGAFYAIRSFIDGNLTDAETFDFNGTHTVSIAQPTIVSRRNAILEVTADVGNAQKQLELDLTVPSPWWDNAVTAADEVEDNIHGLDDDGVEDSTLIEEHVPDEDMPTLDVEGMKDIAVNIAPLTIAGGDTYPSPLNTLTCGADHFFKPDCATPYVTYINGDFTINGNAQAYGVFLVENGDVVLAGTVNVHGVIILLSDDHTVIRGNDPSLESPSIDGGILSWGDVSANGKHINVQHDSTYMNAVAQFDQGTTGSDYSVVWQYK